MQAAFGFSNGPLTRRTGAAVDGGINCSACHRTFAPANQDPRGRLAIELASYRPGNRQVVRVTIEHPDAMRWGFQLTARGANDNSKSVGTFTANSLIRVVCGAGGTAQPCGAEQEFATHLAASTRLGSNGRMTFEVEWTPPSEDVGDVIFYAAGNAADGNAIPTNDVIYTTSQLVRNAAGCSSTGTPTVSGFSNAGSGQSGIAYNTLFSVYGTDLISRSRTRSAQGFDIQNARFPTQLDCVAIEVDGQRVPITFAQHSQINAQAPASIGGPGRVEVIVNPGTSNERRVTAGSATIAAAQPGFFTFDGRSIAALSSDFLTLIASPQTVAGARPARPGEVIVLFLTGLGRTAPIWQSGEVTNAVANATDAIAVRLGTTALAPADILYAGVTPQSISGLYQLNIRIPVGTAAGNVPVSVTAGGIMSMSGATIAVQ